MGNITRFDDYLNEAKAKAKTKEMEKGKKEGAKGEDKDGSIPHDQLNHKAGDKAAGKAPKFGTPEYWTYLKSKKKGGKKKNESAITEFDAYQEKKVEGKPEDKDAPKGKTTKECPCCGEYADDCQCPKKKTAKKNEGIMNFDAFLNELSVAPEIKAMAHKARREKAQAQAKKTPCKCGEPNCACKKEEPVKEGIKRFNQV